MNIRFQSLGDLQVLHLLTTIMVCILSSCHFGKEVEKYTNKDIANIMGEVTAVMVHDVTNPPLASRFYAYISLAGLQALNPDFGHNIFESLEEYNRPTDILDNEDVNYQLAAILAMTQTAKLLLPSGDNLEKHLDNIKKTALSKGISKKILRSTDSYSKAIAMHIIEYANTDGYRLISSLPRYETSSLQGNWVATPPGYFPAVEPYFNTLRPFFLDSANQFVPELPVPYEEEAESKFFHLALEVFDQNLSEEQLLIAAFWDCNPFALDENGHLLIGLKKISPGAHWIGIANIACKLANLGFEKTMEINAVLSMTIFDSFIACWDEKYRSNRVRPETAIRKLIDPGYKPFLQTPPFPEYLSGHSVVSTASAEILTKFFGENFAYVDTVEVAYGLDPRKFNSFKEAAQEASFSRLYGGIHFKDGIVEGQVQGKKIGSNIVNKLGLTEVIIADNN